MTKTEFIKKVVDAFELSNCDQDKISKQLDVYKDFLQQQNQVMNLTRLDGDDVI
ncbi:MAG: hypothetical protein MJ219_00810 [Mycoplasmoidaceae bacterium]|nr:hypothetical protein [Mycoplasmoidaceae bacterium]